VELNTLTPSVLRRDHLKRATGFEPATLSLGS
jgi:hypothetical protein